MMKKILYLTLFVLSLSPAVFGQTMTFNSGAAETGFTFSGWNAASGTIWVANLATTATITKNTGTWTLVSFHVGPYVGANIMRVEDNLGHSYEYNSATAATYTLNWAGITTLTFSRVSGSGASADIDDIVYTSCTDPTIPTVTHTPATVCNGSTATLNISGTLNDATSWKVYSGSCGGTLVGSTTGSSLVVTPALPNTTYYVRGEGGCVSPGSCASHIVTVTPLQSAAFNYSASSYCKNAADPTPTITGVTGGTFSSSPAGLSLNTTTGAIDVSASTAGPYTITYTTPGPCPGTATASVTINSVETATINYSLASYCANGSDPLPTITGVGGGTFSSVPSGLSINSSTGLIDVSASTANGYTVNYVTPGGCPGTATDAVAVVASDNAAFHYASAAYCINGTDPSPVITGLTGGAFSITPGGLSLNTATGVIDLSASVAGAYTITYTTAGPCPNTANFALTINTLDNASFNYSGPSYCANGMDPAPVITGMTGGAFSSSPAGLSINAATGVIDVSASTAGPYVVTYTTAGACSNFSNAGISINAADNAAFGYSLGSYCNNGTDPTPTISGLSGGSFSSTAGISLAPATGTLDLSASTAGPYTITYTTNGACPNTSNVSISIVPVDNAAFNYSASDYCSNGSDPTPVITGLAGGSFSSSAGISIAPSTGIIDLSASTAGPYTITYTTAGACPNSSNVLITIHTLDDASFHYSQSSYCSNGIDPFPSITGFSGGSFSSTAGLSLNSATGVVDLSASSAGLYDITYTTPGSCSNSSNVSMTIISQDNASFSYTGSSFCVNGSDPTPAVTGLSGGSFSGTAGLLISPATGTIDLSGSSTGLHSITYTTNGDCPNSLDVALTVLATDDASFNYAETSYCGNGVNPGPTVTGLNGGSFSSTAGLSINPASGVIDLAGSASGNYSITYTTNGSCPNTSNQSLTIYVVDNSITINNATLIANLSGATYQWINCSSMLAVDFETNQSFSPSANGYYAVVVTQNGCSDTSNCFDLTTVGISEHESDGVKVFPNPTSGIFNIILMGTYDINVLDVRGRIVYSGQMTDQKLIDLGKCTPGTYVLQLKQAERTIYLKLLVQ
jgi:hypothetical protein